MESVRKRVLRFSPAREEEEEKLLVAVTSLERGKKRRVEEGEQEQDFRDIISVTILRQLWHVADTIFKHLDAVSLLHCEKVFSFDSCVVEDYLFLCMFPHHS